ncbi:hypothetical protein LZ32DRAFT_102939 [Colletotrichum eremochloae]|nr:hypothetical protein LZ32DRAFT_102939 [Colletotrichum eremochloae]
MQIHTCSVFGVITGRTNSKKKKKKDSKEPMKNSFALPPRGQLCSHRARVSILPHSALRTCAVRLCLCGTSRALEGLGK